MEQEILAILKLIQKDIVEIKTDISTLKEDVDIIKTNLTSIDKNLNKIKERQDTLCLASSTTILDKIQSTSSLHALEEIVKQNCYDIACLKAKSKNY